MSYLPSLPATAALPEVLNAYPDAGRAVAAYTQIVMRGRSAFRVEDRELIPGVRLGAERVRVLRRRAFCGG